MNLRIRIAVLALGIALLVGLLSWVAQSSWQQIAVLRGRLTTVQLESYRLADHFQETILGLNNTLLFLQIRQDPAIWTGFLKASKELDDWIDQQRPGLDTPREKRVLDQINAAYDTYLTAAKQIGNRSRPAETSGRSWLEFAQFERASERLLNLAGQLAEAHRRRLDSFLEDTHRSLGRVRVLLLGSLVLLLSFGAGLAVVVYRELIAPLRVQLVESRALAERHEKLAALGMLAAGIAHEVRNPLTAIKARLFTQEKRLAPESQEKADAQFIGQEINRLERLVREFLQLGRPSEPQMASVFVEQPLREVQALLAPHLAKANIQLALAEAPRLAVRMDLEQIKQVLINLVQNAAESIGQNGAITLGARQDAVRLADRPTPAVILEVSDTGKGIPPDVQKRLFDPFFTTKQAGTGLGLSIAVRIVEKHGGVIQYQTQVGHGTTFGVALPCA